MDLVVEEIGKHGASYSGSKTEEIDWGHRERGREKRLMQMPRSFWQKREKDKIMLSMKCTERNQIVALVYDLIRVK